MKVNGFGAAYGIKVHHKKDTAWLRELRANKNDEK